MNGAAGTGPDQVAACAGCGATTAGLPIDWMFDQTSDRRVVRWFCGSCAREHLRSVEAKLDQQWW